MLSSFISATLNISSPESSQPNSPHITSIYWQGQTLYTVDDILKQIQNKTLNIWTAVFILHREPSQKGIWPLICNELTQYSTEEIGFFLPQFCNRILLDQQATPLVRVLMDKCASLSIALGMYFWLQAAIEDGCFSKPRATALWHETEMAAVNSTSKTSLRLHRFSNDEAILYSPRKKIHHKRSTSVPKLPTDDSLICSTSGSKNHLKNSEKDGILSNNSDICSSKSSTLAEQEIENEEDKHHTSPSSGSHPLSMEFLDDSRFTKIEREHYFHSQIHFILCLTTISTSLKPWKKKELPKAELNKKLGSLDLNIEKRKKLSKSNFFFKLVALVDKVQQNVIATSLSDMNFSQSNLDTFQKRGLTGIYLPLFFSGTKKVVYHRVVRLLSNESCTLSSRDRVPYILYLETIAFEEDEDKPNKHSLYNAPSSSVTESQLIQALEKIVTLKREMKDSHSHSSEDEWTVVDIKNNNPYLEDTSNVLNIAYPEPWEEKQRRIQRSSPFGTHPNWRLHSVIVKSGDDLRQEQLAVQLISIFHQIFRENDIPCWLYPYYVIATSSESGLIETIPDAISLDNLKKKTQNISSFREYFSSAYGSPETIRFITAQRNFVESLAGYSLVCYLLQIKDRHNGNILMHREGYLIHIDYGFMLTSSPGNITFETAPFKLTKDFIDVMGGEQSDMFHYFKILFIRGFLELRRHASKIITLVEMLLPGEKMGCFYRRDSVIPELKERFKLDSTDEQCVTYCQDLVKESTSNWRTQGYDSYQYLTNGILS